MKTSELVEFLKTQEYTETQAYNLIVNDLYEFISEDQVINAQRLVSYFMNKIQSVCLVVIKDLREIK